MTVNHPHAPPDGVNLGRRSFLFSGVSVATAALTGCTTQWDPMPQPTATPEVGFTLATPRGDCREFREDLHRVIDLGANWVRFAIDYYEAVDGWEPERGLQWNNAVWRCYETAFDLASDAGLSIAFMTVNGVEQPEFSQYIDIMSQYWETLASQFGEGVKVWQVFNEADGMDFQLYTPINDESFAPYMDRLNTALRVARESIHTHARSVSLTTNAAGYPVVPSLEDKWRRYFAPITDQLDILSVDVYPVLDHDAIDSMPGMLQRLAHDVELPVGVMEFGLQTGPDLYTEEQQARALTLVLEALSPSVSRYAMVYRLRDNGAVNDDGFGLYTIDGLPKSSVEEVTECIRNHYP